MSDPPPWEVEPPKAPPAPKPAPRPTPAPAPAPAPASGAIGGGWAALYAELKRTLSTPDFTFIGNPDMVGGSVGSDTVTIWLSADYLRGFVDIPVIRTALATACMKLWGRPFQIVYKVGKAPAEVAPLSADIPAPAAEEFDALEAFLTENQGLGNITVSD